MRFVEQSFQVLDLTLERGMKMLHNIERAGRTCYKSESAFTDQSAREFAANILTKGHESVIEHESVSVRFICDRGVSHEIVRHRLASYSQESTRYCNYAKERHGSEIAVIEPPWPDGITDQNLARTAWHAAMIRCEAAYFNMIALKVPPEIARSVLPNSLKTELVMTANLREWRHFFDLRTSKKAHPQMRALARPLLQVFRQAIPVIFDDVGVVDDGEQRG